jgi:hypothetical protein
VLRESTWERTDNPTSWGLTLKKYSIILNPLMELLVGYIKAFGCFKSSSNYRVCSSCSCFALIILKIGSHKLFAWAGLEPWSSWSQVSQVGRITCVSHQHLTLASIFVKTKFQLRYIFLFVCFMVLGFELKASLLLGRHLSHSTSPVLCWVLLR